MAGPIVREIKTITATMPSGAATSSAFAIGGYAIVGMKVPLLTSALLSFAVGFTGSPPALTPIYDRGGNPLTVATPGGTGGVAIGADSLAPLAAYSELLFVSAAAAQTALRNFIFNLKG